MIKHYCDACEKEIDRETGVIGAKELTVEDDAGLKVSVSFEIDTMKSGVEIKNPAICARCIARRITEWAVSMETGQ
jgi:hypothetical protein